jgi:hypothetical protein
MTSSFVFMNGESQFMQAYISSYKNDDKFASYFLMSRLLTKDRTLQSYICCSQYACEYCETVLFHKEESIHGVLELTYEFHCDLIATVAGCTPIRDSNCHCALILITQCIIQQLEYRSFVIRLALSPARWRTSLDGNTLVRSLRYHLSFQYPHLTNAVVAFLIYDAYHRYHNWPHSLRALSAVEVMIIRNDPRCTRPWMQPRSLELYLSNAVLLQSG